MGLKCEGSEKEGTGAKPWLLRSQYACKIRAAEAAQLKPFPF
jgi:hypothetical protein